jgi:hypothetical protein
MVIQYGLTYTSRRVHQNLIIINHKITARLEIDVPDSQAIINEENVRFLTSKQNISLFTTHTDSKRKY